MNLIRSHILKSFLLLTSASIFAGCAVNSTDQLLDAGHTPLEAESLYALVADHTLQLTAGDFDGRVYFREGGKLSGLSRAGEKDSGKWDITSDNLLCLDFNSWYFGDLKCYSVFAEPADDSYIFFTPNGARYYTATPLAVTPAELTGIQQGKRSSYLKKRSHSENTESHPEQPTQNITQNAPAPTPSKAEMKHLLVTTAQNCPNCDLSGLNLTRADLKNANLSGANLIGTDLSRANLRRANLSGANLRGANLTTANLTGADLTNCNLRDADFTGANLVKADLTGALTDGIILQGTHLEGTTGIK